MHAYLLRLHGLTTTTPMTAATANQAARIWAARLPLSTWNGNQPVMVDVIDELGTSTTFVIRPRLQFDISAV